jgi:hypothetical protein
MSRQNLLDITQALFQNKKVMNIILYSQHHKSLRKEKTFILKTSSQHQRHSNKDKTFNWNLNVELLSQIRKIRKEN